jgi:hypothetical protein
MGIFTIPEIKIWTQIQRRKGRNMMSSMMKRKMKREEKRRRRRRRRKRRRMVQNGKLLVRVMRCKIGLSPRIKTQIGHTRVTKRQVQVLLFSKALHYGIFSVLSVRTSGDFTSCCLSFYFAIGFFLPTRIAGALSHAHKGQIQ